MKPIEDYSKVNNNGSVYRTYCKKCAVKMVQVKRREDKNWWRKYHLKKHFNMSMDDFDMMLSEQNYKCAICDNEFDMDVHGKQPNLDHCHITGEVRKILCFNCNTGIGKFNDDPVLIKKAYKYLINFKLTVNE